MKQIQQVQLPWCLNVLKLFDMDHYIMEAVYKSILEQKRCSPACPNVWRAYTDFTFMSNTLGIFLLIGPFLLVKKGVYLLQLLH